MKNPPRFEGQYIFGDFDSFTVAVLRGDAPSVDTFLGLTPRPTRYGADPGGRLFGVTGKFIGKTTGDVSTLETGLTGFTRAVATFGFPTTDLYPSNFRYWPNCYFVAAEYIRDPAGIVVYRGNKHALSFSMVVRQIPPGT